ncbi:hypothetical protein [Actinacidiphila guanduensis]|uniref:Uncharacterized protein n=1 Tax=Actinacidiphila guanduensis TaxID=310781 RepID=A0A1H0QYX4_9ACTN|nr:hypothetical protein [Actinacidiphila guanduensis]SDP22513.1 hypothetical protein SAMN05216259_12059 [Actinacidiphila guanduensis]
MSDQTPMPDDAPAAVNAPQEPAPESASEPAPEQPAPLQHAVFSAEAPAPEAPAAFPAPLPPLPPALPPEPTATARPRRRTALVTAGVLVAVAACGGVGYAVLHGGDGKNGTHVAAPWTAPTPTATKAFGARSGGSHYGSLRLLLLPIPEGYGPGEDVDAYGNDVVLGVKQATDLFRGDLSDLSAKERKQLDKSIDALHIEGAGMRTYSKNTSDMEVQIRLVQMKNEEGARAQTDFFRDFSKALGVFRDGPKIKGYPKAACFLPPADKSDKLDEMTCEATEGDLMVELEVEGVKPLQKNEAAALFRKQLDRVRDPGEAV